MECSTHQNAETQRLTHNILNQVFNTSFCHFECTSQCFLNVPWCANAFPQSLHMYGFCPVCVRKWIFRFVTCVNVLLHSEQLYGFTDRWIFLWTARVHDSLKVLLHTSHLYFFCSECRCLCWRKRLGLENVRSHSEQAYGRSPVCW